jgi:hypothetical protein
MAMTTVPDALEPSSAGMAGSAVSAGAAGAQADKTNVKSNKIVMVFWLNRDITSSLSRLTNTTIPTNVGRNICNNHHLLSKNFGREPKQGINLLILASYCNN